jgi:ribosome modulation factor
MRVPLATMHLECTIEHLYHEDGRYWLQNVRDAVAVRLVDTMWASATRHKDGMIDGWSPDCCPYTLVTHTHTRSSGDRF